ncbi:YceI family protein [Phenylobacterium sp.]|uniref:YceI family protein n=1 Tax=Phenylobacterium sp. TaxID=1871053 RepID=UPI0035AF6787
MKPLFAACALVALAACSPKAEKTAAAPPEAAQPQPPKSDAPAGTYALDKAHGSIVFRVNHLGLSNYTARFTRFDAELKFDPADPAASSVTATIDPASIQTDYPFKDVDFDAQLSGKDWLNAAQFPQMTFKSTSVTMTGPATADVTGDFSLHGVTRPVTLKATFNGGYAGNGMDPAGSRIGFSADGVLNRSEFGMGYGVPPKGSTFGVGDPVSFHIEAEFTRPIPKAAGDSNSKD